MIRGLLFLAVLLAANPSMAQVCTQIGCQNGLSFQVDPDYDWKPGQYDVDIQLQFRRIHCHGELPLYPCEDGPTFSCDDRRVTITESGCALPGKVHGIGAIHIADEPDRVIIRIARNGIPIITRTVVPQYETSRPNGPGCGPVCRSASFDLLRAQ